MCSSDLEAGVVRVDGACRELFDIYTKVSKHLVELIASRVRRMAFRYGYLEASGDELLLDDRSLLIEVSSNDHLAAWELGKDVVYGDQKAVNRLVSGLALLWCQIDA